VVATSDSAAAKNIKCEILPDSRRPTAGEAASDRDFTMSLLSELPHRYAPGANDGGNNEGQEAGVALSIRSLAIPDIKLVRMNRFTDARGYFCETFQRPAFAAQGLDCDFLQDNQSRSDHSGTVRGLHFQRPPFAQTKLVRVLRGRILDVAVDLRRSSPSFGRHVAVELNGDSDEQLFIPVGFAHGFCTLEPETIVFYKVDRVYSAAHDGGINWIDSRLAIDWPVTSAEAVVSEKDRELPRFDQLGQIFQ
jgi:dTDP-4-dehydrorhamnose 3,5-epimerase